MVFFVSCIIYQFTGMNFTKKIKFDKKKYENCETYFRCAVSIPIYPDLSKKIFDKTTNLILKCIK